jgi:Opioid growth factor receptor (OGFr) conserved region
MSSKIVDFYLGAAPDSEGRTIEQIWAWDYSELEYVHNYIQWLFPLTEASNFNYEAPILIELDIKQFWSSETLKKQLLTSFKIILGFYGLQCVENNNSVSIGLAETFEIRKQEWLQWVDHNHLRITRILKSLKLLGLEQYAQATFL